MFCECLQNKANGELDCNYTMIDKMKTTTLKSIEFSTEPFSFTTSSLDLTTMITTTMKNEETMTETSIGFSTSPSSITENVPMTTTSMPEFDIKSSTTTMEILDLSKAPTATTTETQTTSETYETTSERFESSIHSTTESTMEMSTEVSSTSIDTSSSSSIFTTTRIPITRTTKLRPCPPGDMTRPPTTTKSSTTVRIADSSTTTMMEFDTTTFVSSLSSSATTSSSSSSSSSEIPISTSSIEFTPTTLKIDETTNESWGSVGTTTEISASSHHVTSSEFSTSIEETSTQAVTSGMTSVVDGMEGTTFQTTTEVISSHEDSSTTEIDKTTTEKTNEVTGMNESTLTAENISTSSMNPEEISTSTLSSSTTSETLPLSTSFKPATDEIFTLTPHDVTTITSSASSCKDMECYNGGMCENTSDGPKCVCPFNRKDSQCQTLIRIKNAAFSGDSYLSHKIFPEENKQETTSEAKNLNQILSMKIEMKARTRATDGLILLASAQGSKGGHYTALFLHKGLLQFQFSCGLQTMLLSELEAPINTGHEFTIQVALDFSANHSHCNASLRINDTLAMSGDQPTWLGEKHNLGMSKTIENVWLHLGGSPQTPVVLMSELPGGQGFTGCLHTLKINDEPKEIFRYGL
jgi:protein eyes shut